MNEYAGRDARRVGLEKYVSCAVSRNFFLELGGKGSKRRLCGGCVRDELGQQN